MPGALETNSGALRLDEPMDIEAHTKDVVAKEVSFDVKMDVSIEEKADVDVPMSEDAKREPPCGPRRIIPVKRSNTHGGTLSMRGMGDALGGMFGLAKSTPRPRIVTFGNRHNHEREPRFADCASMPRQFYNKKRTVGSLIPTEPQYKKRRRNPDEAQNGERAPSPDLEEKLKDATTLYVGNLSFFTTEEQIHELFSKAGEIKRLVMGLDRFTKTPCGFCFVEYYTHADALDCLKYIGGTKLDERIIRTDLDEGFSEGRQYGRGKSGGQVRDEYRQEYDPGRGGFGKGIGDEGYADEYMGGR